MYHTGSYSDRVRRTLLNFRIGTPTLATLDSIATETGVTRSAVIRMCLRIALGDPDALVRRLTAEKERVL